MNRLWLVEVDEALRDTLALNLAREGYQVTHIGDGATALRLAQQEYPDLLVLDISLRGIDATSLCRTLRQEMNVPIVVLTSQDSPMDPIAALDSGADDCMVKPFSLGEFAARLRALLRRAPNASTSKLQSGDVSLDLVAFRAFHRGENLKLSRQEFRLLAELMQHTGAVLSRQVLLSRLWGTEHEADTRTVDVHIRSLREKIEDDPANPQRIQTVRGIGYRFDR
jgi:DNA-binding response OmpR family regulator